MNDQSRPGESGSEKTIAAVNTILPNAAANSTQRIPAYVVLPITKYGRPNRRVYLDLGSARNAVQRAHANSQRASLVLCELRAVQADIDGEVAP
jgi:hypothetical protein